MYNIDDHWCPPILQNGVAWIDYVELASLNQKWVISYLTLCLN